MSNTDIGIIGIIVLFILLFSRLPIGITMGLVGFIGFAYVAGLLSAFGVLKTVPFSTYASYSMSVVPLFLLMGSFAFFSGLSKDLYDAVHAWLGHLRGGLAMATVGACAGFAAICGSSLATAATFGKVALPEMKRYKYNMGLATAAVAAGGTIGILIPPSVIFVVYGILTGQSIGKLFLAGFMPGALQAIFYMITISLLCWHNPSLGPQGPVSTFKEKILSLKGSWVALLLFLIVIGGLYLGVFSPTEAAGIGAFATFVFGIARRRLNWNGIKESLIDTGKSCGMIFLLLTGAMIFGYFLSVTGINTELAKALSGMQVSRYIILLMIIIVYLILGCCMDSMAMILLTVPIFFPVVQALNFDPIWFGVIIVRMVEIGMITPPVGLNVYVIAGLAPEVPMFTIFRGIIPFIFADVIHVALLIAFPQIALFLPSLMK